MFSLVLRTAAHCSSVFRAPASGWARWERLLSWWNRSTEGAFLPALAGFCVCHQLELVEECARAFFLAGFSRTCSSFSGIMLKPGQGRLEAGFDDPAVSVTTD